jgi:hypothetical protein
MSETTTIIEAARLNLLSAAVDIKRYGWKTGGATPDSNNDDAGPRCVWIAYTYAFDKVKDSFNPAYRAAIFDVGERYLINAANTYTLDRLFDINDSKSPEEGPQWAVETLRKAAETAKLELADVRLERKAMDTDSTSEMESGNTTNAVGPLKRLLKRLHLVK